jgi:hypothetical protein
MLNIVRMLKRTRSASQSSDSSEQQTNDMSYAVVRAGDKQRTCTLTCDACQTLNELRRNNLLCDARIATANERTDKRVEFPVHRLVMAGNTRTNKANRQELGRC